MSFVTTQPEALSSAAGSLQGIGSSLSAQNAAAEAPTTGVVPAAADEVSALTA
ncbi:MAG: PE family protein, partial [Mycobacterium sp.]|nr:PE family protein [Mycobacterium sp.]